MAVASDSKRWPHLTEVFPTDDKILRDSDFSTEAARKAHSGIVERRLHPIGPRPMTITHVLARITGRRRPPPEPAADPLFLGALSSAVAEDVSRQVGRPCEVADFRATRTGSLTIRLTSNRLYVAKVPLHATTEPRLRKNADTLEALGQQSWVTPYLSARWPGLVATGTASDHFYSVETAVAGRDGASMLKDGSGPEEMILSAGRFLSKLQKASLQADPGAPRWEATFESALRRVETLAKRAGAARSYARLVCDITNQFSGRSLPAVYAHGNFWLGNALFDGSGSLTGVIDWDCSDASSLPALDFVYLLVRTHSLARAASFGEALGDWIAAESLPFLDSCMARHCLELEIPADLIPALSYGTWIQHLDSHCRYGTRTSTDPRWLQRNVRDVLDRWQSQTTARREAVHRWLGTHAHSATQVAVQGK
jgi:aminoglycoside phosphotransferase (APT) family kinase protein